MTHKKAAFVASVYKQEQEKKHDIVNNYHSEKNALIIKKLNNQVAQLNKELETKNAKLEERDETLTKHNSLFSKKIKTIENEKNAIRKEYEEKEKDYKKDDQRQHNLEKNYRANIYDTSHELAAKFAHANAEKGADEKMKLYKDFMN